MLANRKGIICKTVKYGETSLILDIFSPDAGMKSYICSGVRKKRSTKSSTLQVMNLIEFICYVKADSKASLLRIKEVKYDRIYSNIPFDVVRGSLGMFLLEISRKAIHQTDDNLSIYQFMQTKFLQLDDASTLIADFHINYLIDLAKLLGFEMQNNYAADREYFSLKDGMFIGIQDDHRYVLDHPLSLILSSYLTGAHAASSKTNRLRLVEHLISYYRYHIDGFGTIKSLDVLKELYQS